MTTVARGFQNRVDARIDACAGRGAFGGGRGCRVTLRTRASGRPRAACHRQHNEAPDGHILHGGIFTQRGRFIPYESHRGSVVELKSTEAFTRGRLCRLSIMRPADAKALSV